MIEYFLLLISVIAHSLESVLVKFVIHTFSPSQIIFYRYLLTTILLTLILPILKFNNINITKISTLDTRALIYCLLIGIASCVSWIIFYFLSTILQINILAPIFYGGSILFVNIFSKFLLGEKSNFKIYIGNILIILGIIIIKS